MDDNSLYNIKRRYELREKYYVYKNEYNESKNLTPEARPELLDALFTGCNLPFAKSSLNKYDEKVEEDIEDIIRLFPDSIDCNLGKLRCKKNITPLIAACVNRMIPVYIIEYLLEKGADPDTVVESDTDQHPSTPIIKDLKSNIGSGDVKRVSELENLFEKYQNIKL